MQYEEVFVRGASRFSRTFLISHLARCYRTSRNCSPLPLTPQDMVAEVLELMELDGIQRFIDTYEVKLMTMACTVIWQQFD